MSDFAFGAASALWLGVLTSISPCPLATNVAAIAFIGKDVTSPRGAFLRGLAYTVGRAIAYIAVSWVILAGFFASPDLSYFFQKHMNRLLGPILLFIAGILFDLFPFSLSGARFTGSTLKGIATRGMGGAIIIGMLFALAFCPVSAALFFGGLLPLAVRIESPFALPTLYGIGTALPVVLFAYLVAVGARSVGALFTYLSSIERWARVVTALIFLVVGLYFTVVFTFGLTF